MASVAELSGALVQKIQEEQQNLQQQEEDLTRRRTELDNEIQAMSAFSNAVDANNEIVSLNIGGEVMATKRSTLRLAEGSLLEAMFSGRWEQSLDRDSDGRFFLDISPAVFRVLLSFLRVARDAPPGKRPRPPIVPTELAQEFNSMIDYLQLRKFIYGDLAVAEESLKLEAKSALSHVSEDHVVRHQTPSQHALVVGRNPLLPEGREAVFWKVIVESFNPGWLFLGVIGNPAAQPQSYADPTAFGWASTQQVYLCGSNLQGNQSWSGWKGGDVALFKLCRATRTLKMKERSAGSVYHLELPSDGLIDRLAVHINTHAGNTIVKVAQASAEECASL